MDLPFHILHSNDDVSLFVPYFDIPVCPGSLFKRIYPGMVRFHADSRARSFHFSTLTPLIKSRRGNNNPQSAWISAMRYKSLNPRQGFWLQAHWMRCARFR